MHEREDIGTDVCALCGEDVDPQDPRDFFASTSIVVCYDCARKHGGVYDPEAERWTVAPAVPKQKRPRKDY